MQIIVHIHCEMHNQCKHNQIQVFLVWIIYCMFGMFLKFS